ncbi:MAG: hypothetical protein R3F34_05945 [Planctomycetota bacterium]
MNENSLLLDDARAVVRVRSARWLATRGIAPKDFDALAPRDRRRAVLETWRREREAAAAAKPATTATTGAGTTTSTAKDAGAAGGKP